MKFQPSVIQMKRLKITLNVLLVGVPCFALALLLCVANFMGKTDTASRWAALLVLTVIGLGVVAAVFIYRALYDPNAERFFPLGGKNAIVGMPREAWLAEKAARREAIGIQPAQPETEGPDTRTLEQKRADAKARRDAEMARIAGQARQDPTA
jgi:cell division protein FtsN